LTHTPNPLERDCLFQLNVLVWACFPQPRVAPVTPVLEQSGYHLWSIEQPLPLSPTQLIALKRAGVEAIQEPVVDAVLQHQEDEDYVILECKPDSFGCGSDRAKQAAALVVAAGDAGAALNRPARARAELCYLVPGSCTCTMDETLTELSAQISQGSLPSPDTGAIGVSIKADGVYLGLSTPIGGEAFLPRRLTPQKLVLAISKGEDPKPLYVVPWMPDAPESELLEFKEKIRAHIVAWLGNAPVGEQSVLTFEDLLHSVTRGISAYWRNKESLVGRVFGTMVSLSRQLFNKDPRCAVKKTELRVTLTSAKEQAELIRIVQKAQMPAALPPGVQLTLTE